MLNPMPSGAKLNYLYKGWNFTIQNWPRKSLENLTKTKVSARYEPVQGYVCLLYVTHRMRRAKINYTMFLTFFEYAESNAERCQAQLFIQKLKFYDSKLASKITRKYLKNKSVSKVWASARLCMLALYLTHGMRRAKINFTMFLTFFEYAESNAKRC